VCNKRVQLDHMGRSGRDYSKPGKSARSMTSFPHIPKAEHPGGTGRRFKIPGFVCCGDTRYVH
jgi:hypothetical protein